MPISSWAVMTKRPRGRQWHCRTGRTINLDYASPPQAMQWPDGRSKHIRQWLGWGNPHPRGVFPISKMRGALIGVPKTSRDTKKHCGEPGCPNDHRSQCSPVATRWSNETATSVIGTFETCRLALMMSVHWGRSEVADPTSKRRD